MEERSTFQKVGDAIAHTLTLAFNPFVIPLFGLLIIFTSPTIFRFISGDMKKLLFVIVFLNNGLLPFALFAYMKSKKMISDWLIYERAERMVPVFTSAVFYALTVYIIWRFNIPSFLKTYFIAAAVLSFFFFFVSLWFKVSIHSFCMGALVALVYVLSIKAKAPMAGYLIVTILLTGMVVSSRLWLKAHTVPEVVVGLLIGLIGTGLILYFA